MQGRAVIANLTIGLISGYVSTRVMETVATKLYESEPEEARRREDAVWPGPPYEIAAQKTTQLLGPRVSNRQIQRFGALIFHYGLGMRWGSVCTFVRRRTDLDPVVTHLRGFVTHLAFGLGVAATSETLFWLGRNAGR
ncbi:MAG: DUF1440 domain-containing protein [Thermomicrobiales bacterium]